MSEPHAHHPTHDADEFHEDIVYPENLPFALVHLACLFAIWSGVTTGALVTCVALYVVRMFGVTAGYHRYFSHRSYKTSRVGQFLLAFLAQSSAQRGALWWAAKHRHHHRHSDTEDDVHSPRMRGFWYSHMGWVVQKQHDATDVDSIPDLTKYPELVWLNQHKYFPATVVALLCLAFGGWSGLVVGFVWSTVLLYHGTFFINSLAHVHGTRRYVTGDDSRNNWWLAVITLGEGWHNNHHAYQRSTRQGFRWYEFDPTFYALKVMSWMRLVWDLGEPPADVVRNERRLGRAVVEKVSRQLAEQFPVDAIAARVREAIDSSPALASLRERVAAGQAKAEHLWAELHAMERPHLPSMPHLPAMPQMPHLPTVADVRARAERALAATPSMDEIVARTREHLLDLVAARLQLGSTRSPAA